MRVQVRELRAPVTSGTAHETCPRRVLMTAAATGGVWTCAFELATALVARRVHVDLATMGAPLSRAQRRQADRPGLTLHESEHALEWMDDPWESVERAGRWLVALERELAPDLVHLNGYAHGALPWRSPAIVVGHSCALSWWEAVHGEPAPARWNRYRDQVRRGLAGAARVVAPTAAMLESLVHHYGFRTRASVVPNGRSRGRFRPGLKRPYVLAAGRLWDEAKNLAALDPVAERLPWRVFVAGDARRPDGCATTLRHAVTLGPLDERRLAGWMNAASIFAAPALYEPFGLAALEAGLAGCALVLGDIPSLREVWGDAACYVPPCDPEALRETLEDFIARPQMRLEYGRRAEERAVGYTSTGMARGYLTVYGEALGAARASHPAVLA